MPSATGSLDSYIQAVNRFPLLTQEEETDCARRLRDERTSKPPAHLVLSHLRLVVSIARGYLGYGLPQADLIQEGNIGLMKAVKRFDPERGVRLVSFAMHWIRAEIHEFILRNWRMVKIATTKAQRKLFFNLRSMKKGLGTLGAEEVQAWRASSASSPRKWSKWKRASAARTSRSSRLATTSDEQYAPIAYLAARQMTNRVALLEARADRAPAQRRPGEALASLDARSRRIIEARWLRESEALDAA